jgi:hypothetical protein
MLVIGLTVWLGLNVMIPILIELATRLDRPLRPSSSKPHPVSSLPFDAGPMLRSHQ